MSVLELQSLQKMRFLVDSGDLIGALKLADTITARATSDGDTLHKIGESDRARSLLESAQLMVPLAVESELTLAEIYVAENENDLAVTLLSNLGIRPDSTCEVRLRAARLLDQTGYVRSAWCVARKAVNESPDEAQAWFDLSVYMRGLRFPFHQFEAAARRAIFLAPDDVNFRVSLASVLALCGRDADAYQLVRSFGPREFQQVCCASCLESLKEIFESSGDWRGSCLASEQLLVHTLDAGGSDCEDV
jgi:tetratricopeptide (TPR) repeat protein